MPPPRRPRYDCVPPHHPRRLLERLRMEALTPWAILARRDVGTAAVAYPPLAAALRGVG